MSNLNQSTIENLQSIEEGIEISGQYFKPEPDKMYVIRMDLEKDRILPVEIEDSNSGILQKQPVCRSLNNSRKDLLY